MSSLDKIKITVEEIKKLSHHIEDKQLVLCGGHFNIIHPGHLRFIQYARTLGVLLCVAVHSDDYLKHKNRKWHHHLGF